MSLWEKFVNKNVLRFILSLKIRQRREDLGLSLKELSQISGLSHSYLNEIEKGKKYPKEDKMRSLAQSLKVETDDLISIDPSHRFHPLLNYLDSDLMERLPLDAFGIGEQDLYDVMSQAPEKFTSFLMTIYELASAYDLGLEDLNRAALRAYQEVERNYDRELERLAGEYHQVIFRHDNYEEQLKEFLESHFQYTVDQKTLGQVDETKKIRALVKASSKTEKKLFLHPNMRSKQRAFIYAREIGLSLLKYQHMPLRYNEEDYQGSFENVLKYHRALYFAGALLLEEKAFTRQVEELFSFNELSVSSFSSFIDRQKASAEVVMNRMTQLLAGHFGLHQFFFLKAEEDLNKPNIFRITKELHLGQLHHPQGISLREHYCRRWITLRSLNEMKSFGEARDCLQYSVMGSEGRRYLCLSLSRSSQTLDQVNQCFTIGIPESDQLKEVVRFSRVNQIESREVGRTCERCPIVDCDERVANYKQELDPQNETKRSEEIERITRKW
jgi:transcriptional regulator with XRE-family HTH domain